VSTSRAYTSLRKSAASRGIIAPTIERLSKRTGALTSRGKLGQGYFQRAADRRELGGDANGTLINSSDLWPVPDVNITDRAYFKAFKSGTETSPILVELARARVAGGWATIVAHKVTGPKGEFIGIVTRAVAPETFEKYFASVALGEGAAISMYLRDGTLLARHPHVERMIGSHVRNSPIYRFISSPSGHGTIRLTSPIDGQERVASAYALRSIPIAIVASTWTTAVRSLGAGGVSDDVWTDC